MSDSRNTANPDADARSDIRGVLIAVNHGRLLLPNATVAEVITYSEPEPVHNAPHWLLGRLRWRGWQLPLVSFARLTGWAEEEGELGAKVAILKLFGGDEKMPYFALLSQGFPRLVTVSRATLLADADATALPPGVQQRVLLNDDHAVVPDLAALEELLAEALAQVA